jgi:hypothetical protein
VRTLTRLGAAYRIQGRTLQRLTDIEVSEAVELVVSLWRERGRAQRWLSVDVRTGSHDGLEIFMPLEVLQGQGDELPSDLVDSVLVE